MLTTVAKIAWALATLLMLVLPASTHRAPALPTATTRKGPRERVLLGLVALASFLPLLWIVTDVLAFADVRPRAPLLGVGVALYAVGLFLLHRTHAELGPSWSITLELRERHRLVTDGLYGRLRHPMYLALLVYAAGQALVVPNLVAGPAYLAAVGLMVALRLGPEERMMAEAFPEAYPAYRARTKRLFPGIW